MLEIEEPVSLVLRRPKIWGIRIIFEKTDFETDDTRWSAIHSIVHNESGDLWYDVT